jgi:hypothetical protein
VDVNESFGNHPSPADTSLDTSAEYDPRWDADCLAAFDLTVRHGPTRVACLRDGCRWSATIGGDGERAYQAARRHIRNTHGINPPGHDTEIGEAVLLLSRHGWTLIPPGVGGKAKVHEGWLTADTGRTCAYCRTKAVARAADADHRTVYVCRAHLPA